MFRVYLTRRDDFAAMNEVYADPGRARPQRCAPRAHAVFLDLPHEVMLDEIDALAVTD